MTYKPMTREQVERQVEPRKALTDCVDCHIKFVAPIMPPRPGVRVFPPPVKGTLVERPDRAVIAHYEKRFSNVYNVAIAELDKAQRRELDEAIGYAIKEIRAKELRGEGGYLPDHLPLHPIPSPLDDKLQMRRFFDSIVRLRKGEQRATTIFDADNRRIFSDTSFPWCTIGRVDGGGQGSGVLVGPRHLLTVSHGMVWNSDGTCNQITFTPSYFDGNAPFGNAGIIHWYAYRKVTGPTLNADDGAEDYVVLVLDQRLGDLCGWMGTRAYDNESWDDDDYDTHDFWTHVGYPGDLAGGNRPSYQADIGMDSAFWDSDSHERLWHQADVWPGQSGGPFFAWFDNEAWPRVTAVQSGQDSEENSASGGYYINNLLNQAKTDFP